MIPYNEDFHRRHTGPTLAIDYIEAGRQVGDDQDWIVWPARVERDVCLGLTYEQSLAKHRAEWRAALGLVDPQPAPGDLANLITRGQFFALETGEHFTAIQCSDFNLLNRWQHGEDIRPVLQQRRDCGYNMLRVWTAYDIPNVGTFTDIDYARVPEFAAFCASYGHYVEFTAYTGINDPAHWPSLIRAAQPCRTRPLLELVNELDQNTNEPDSHGRIFRLEDYAKAPAPLLSSHGSNGSQAPPVLPVWTYTHLHLNDAFEWWRKPHNGMEVADEHGVPCHVGEMTRTPDRDSNPDHFFDAGACSALLPAGGCLHSVQGKLSGLWQGIELVCANAFAAGARSVTLGCQDGPYTHRADLEGSTYLRVYERPVNGLMCQVYIRK